jgi:glycosyltransferase involved in cell wall biosynthesis
VVFEYTIAGGGPEIPVIASLARDLGLQEEVLFHPGFRGADYVAALQSADVYLLPSFREAFGLTMVEAVLAGCYPLVADASMPGEIIRYAGGSAVPVTTPERMIEDIAHEVIMLSKRRDLLFPAAVEIAAKVTTMFRSQAYSAAIEDAYTGAMLNKI